MPREQLRALAADVDRLIVAGSSSVAGDEGLGRRAEALRALAAKVPALGSIAGAIDRARAADAHSAARALLDLLLVVGQARAATATAGVEGAVSPVDPAGPWETEAPVRDVYTVARALAEPGPGRVQVVGDAVEREACADLRLLGPLLDGRADPSRELADLIADRALPAFGRAVLPELSNRRDLRGAALARTFRAVYEIDPGACLDEFGRMARSDPAVPAAERASALREVFHLATVRKKFGGGTWDPRWVPLILDHLKGPEAHWAEDALAKLPRPRSADLPILLRDLDLAGFTADALRLEAIVAIDPEAGLELCRKALDVGSPVVKAQARRCLDRSAGGPPRPADVGAPSEAARAALDAILGRAADPAALRRAAEDLRRICGPGDLPAIREARAEAAHPGLRRALDEVIRHLTRTLPPED